MLVNIKAKNLYAQHQILYAISVKDEYAALFDETFHTLFEEDWNEKCHCLFYELEDCLGFKPYTIEVDAVDFEVKLGLY